MRETGLSIEGIRQLFCEEHPETVISVLLREQKKALEAEISEAREQLRTLEGIQTELKGVRNFTVESIGDIAHMMKSKEKRRKMLRNMVIAGVILEIIQIITIVAGIKTGMWWPFAAELIFEIGFGVGISRYYYKYTAYICPECHITFRTSFKEVFFAHHTPKLRKVTCPGSDKGVTDLSLHVASGDLYAFIGHNGAGKTTTLKAVVGIHDFDCGEIIINGTDLKTDPMTCKKQFAYIPDNPDLYEYLTGIQYLNFVADIFEVPADLRRERIREYGDAFEITESLGDLILSYSHGMKQKLAMIAALLHAPKLLILDEPFVGLDPKAAVLVKQFMKELCADGGAVFFSTHVLEVAEKLCNKVAIIKDGRLADSGKMEDIVKPGQSLEDIFMKVAVDDK